MQDTIISSRTGKTIDYAYYTYLQRAYRDRSITDAERFDLELALFKYETNSYYR